MADVFVDLLYRGLPLGNRVRLARVEARSGYLEVPTPMPVGTRLSIASGDLVVGAKVIEVVEQTAGSDRPPGMLVRPHLEGEAQRSWWAKAAGSSADAELPVSAPSVPANGAPPVAEAPVAEAPVAVAPVAAVAPAPVAAAPVAAVVPAPVAAVAAVAAAPVAAVAAGAVMAAMEDVPTMPHVLELDSTSDEAALAEAGDVDPVIEPPPPGVGAPAEGRAEASPGAEVAEVADGAELGDSIDPDGEESPELPDPPAVAGAAPRGRKRRRNRR